MKYNVEQQVEQPSLFSVQDLAGTYKTQPRDNLEMSAIALQDWKQRVMTYQQQVPIAPSSCQTALFTESSLFSDLSCNDRTPQAAIDPALITDPEQLDPFALPQQNTQFWRWRASDAGVPALYFVIDYAASLLLYIGETVKSNQRWQGEHDCKRYLLHYQQAHYNNHLPTQLGIAFWKDAPAATRSRQKIELQLIHKWRSPFNKENWILWNTPFVAEK
ncbi:MAG: GIY-YIG nuclease family protein [Synechococcales bacterium]|nr:GIY-YIG nuclease family protein [Synechococcales bacterium]